MSTNCYRRLAVTLGSTQPFVEQNYMTLSPAMFVANNRICRFHIRPPQIMIGHWRGSAQMDLPATGMHRRG